MGKKRPLTERQRLTRNIKKVISRATKRGYVFEDIDFKHLSESQLRELSGKGIYSRGYYVLQSTGEVVSGTTGLHLERQAAAAKGLATKARRAALAKQATDDEAYRRYLDAVAQEAYDRSLAVIENLRQRIVKMQIPEGYTRRVKGRTFTHKPGVVELERILSAKIMLLNYIDGAIAKAGISAVAQNYDSNIEEINDILDYLAKYGIDENDYTGGNAKLTRFVSLLVGRPISMEEYDELDTIETGLDYIEDMT